MRQTNFKGGSHEKCKHKTVICNLCKQEYDICDVEVHRANCPSDKKNKKAQLPEEGKIHLKPVSAHSRSDVETKEIA